MSWTVVVSQDESFVRRAIDGLRDSTNVVGATGASAASALLASLDVHTVIVDAADEVGRTILAALRLVRGARIQPRVIAVDCERAGLPEAHVPGLHEAIETALAVA